MRHILLLAIFITGLGFLCSYSWHHVHHKTSDTEKILGMEMVVENLCDNASCRLINTGDIFGSEESFQKVNDNLTKTEDPNQLVQQSVLIKRTWIIKRSGQYHENDVIAKVYWNENSYYISKAEHYNIRGTQKHLSPDGNTVKYIHIWDNWFLVLLLIIVEVVAGIIAFLFLDRLFFSTEDR